MTTFVQRVSTKRVTWSDHLIFDDIKQSTFEVQRHSRMDHVVANWVGRTRNAFRRYSLVDWVPQKGKSQRTPGQPLTLWSGPSDTTLFRYLEREGSIGAVRHASGTHGSAGGARFYCAICAVAKVIANVICGMASILRPEQLGDQRDDR